MLPHLLLLLMLIPTPTAQTIKMSTIFEKVLRIPIDIVDQMIQIIYTHTYPYK